MANMDFADFCDQIENERIQVCFLFAVGRSGSVLLQSFIDNHSEVLMLPQILDYYSFNERLSQCKNYIELINLFISDIYMKNRAFSHNLGENRDEVFDKQEQVFAQTILKTLEKLKTVNRKSFLLAIHYSYAVIKNIDLSKIKAIVIHQHNTRSFLFFNVMNLFNTSDSPGFIKIAKDIFLKKSFIELITDDFPGSKFIATVRNPYDLLTSFLKSAKKETINFELFYNDLYVTSFCFYDLANLKNIKYFKFEDMHKNTLSEMQSLALYLGITFSETLLKSTIDGKLWWGNNPQKIINGPQKNLDTTKWKHLLEPQAKLLVSFLFKDILQMFNYERVKYKKEITSKKIFKPIKNEFESYIYYYLNEYSGYNHASTASPDVIYFPEFYPLQRNFLINFFVNGINSDFPKAISFKDMDLYFHYDYHHGLELDDKGYIILLQECFFNSLPEKKMKLLRLNTDQIWVTNKYTKDIFINSGIAENKIKMLPISVDTSIFYPSDEFDKDSNLFKFLFIGNFEEELTLVLNAFSEEFSNNEPVKLIIKRNVKNLEPYDDNKDLNYLNAIINNELKNKIELIKSKISPEMQKKLYNISDCAVYPYRLPYYTKNVLEGMACGLPAIITNSILTQDMCNPKNSFLLNCTKQEYLLPVESELNELVYFYQPEYEHLKSLMRYTFNNREQVKVKGLKAVETVEKKFSLDKNIKKAFRYIRELNGKPLSRGSS